MARKKTTLSKTRNSTKTKSRSPIRRVIYRSVDTGEADGQYFLKIVSYVIAGAVWLKFAQPVFIGQLPVGGLPIGLFVGMIIASRDRFQIDRKIAYVILIIMAVLSYFLPIGIVV